jgi:inner membrane protein
LDPVSQGSLGAAFAASAGRGHELRAGAVAGLFAGMAPDLDVLIRSSADPLLFLEYHRQFTHALAFVPIGALLCALAAYPLARRWIPFGRLYLFCLLGYGSHGLLDACTSYGTQLLWPLSDVRLAWNVVSVVDPLFTLPLLTLLLFGWVRQRRTWALAGLVWVGAYLVVGQIQHWRAQQAALDLAAARGHVAGERLTKPAFANLLVWKSVYRAEGWFYVDALRLGSAATVYPGQRIRALGADPAWRPPPPGSQLAEDVARFRAFSAGYLARDRADDDLVIDVRYSLVPNRIDALWGIALDRSQPDGHAEFVTDRATGAEERAALVEMLTQPGVPPAEVRRPGSGASAGAPAD